MEHIRGFISRLEPPLVDGPLDRSRYNPPYHTSAPFIPSLPARRSHKKRSGVNVAFKLVKKLAPASGRTDGQAPSPPPPPFSPLFYCVVARGAINSRGFTVPWKSAKHPPANIIHGTRPLFLRVTFPPFAVVSPTREFNGRNRVEDIAADRRRLRNSLIPPCEVRRNAECCCHLSYIFFFLLSCLFQRARDAG